jgi:hypothetical protein
MARKSIGFRRRFPHFGLFLVIAVTLAIPLTVWSLNNVSTNTQQHAAGSNSTSQNILCGYPKYYCPNGFTCGHCTGGIPSGSTSKSTKNTGCECIPNSTPTPIPQSKCYYSPCPTYLCIKGQPCPTCTPKLICPTLTPIPPAPTTCGPTNPKVVCLTGQACVYSNGQYVCTSGYTCHGISGGTCPSGQICGYDGASLTDICMPNITPTPKPISQCNQLAGTCVLNGTGCPQGLSRSNNLSCSTGYYCCIGPY